MHYAPFLLFFFCISSKSPVQDPQPPIPPELISADAAQSQSVSTTIPQKPITTIAAPTIIPYDPKPEISLIDRNGVITPEEFPYHKELKFLRKGAGKIIGSFIMSKHASKAVGWFQNKKTVFSINWRKFATKHKINLDECVIPEGGFASFNDFFTRKLKPGARPIDPAHGGLVSPADAKVTYVENISKKDIFIIKNSQWSLRKMLGNGLLAHKYEGGTLISFRLAPEDYHRFHFPCDATPTLSKKIAGKYDSVNPYVFKHGHDPLGENARNVLVLKSKEFADPVCVIVGAMGVGKIIETYKPHHSYRKGDEMGYFKFGASTVCLIFRRGVICPASERFTKNSQRMIETAVKQGELIALKNTSFIENLFFPHTAQQPQESFFSKIGSYFGL